MADDVVNEMTDPNLDLEALVGELRRHLPLLDSAAMPSKSEVFTICGRPARDLHNAIISVTDRLQASEAEVVALKSTRWSAQIHADFEARVTTAEAALAQRDEVIRGLELEVAAYRLVAVNLSWNHNMANAYGRDEYEGHQKKHVDECAMNAMAKAPEKVAAYVASRTPPGSDEALQDTGEQGR